VGGRSVVTGNGLLSGLRLAAAILKLNLSMEEAAEPFRPAWSRPSTLISSIARVFTAVVRCGRRI